MKDKMKQFAKGDFQMSRPEIVFPQTHIFMTIGEGEIYSGSFTIQSQSKEDIRGIVYSSSFRVNCSEQGFEGNPVKVNFTFDSTGLLPGQTEKGKFTIMCNGGEYELAFTAVIENPFIMTSYGKIQNVEDFKHLAAKEFSEAARLFRTRQFYDVLKYEDVRVKNLYAHMRKWALDEQAMEEFLVGIKQKEKIFLTLSEEEKEWEDVLEAKKDWIEITKNTWGFLPVHFRAEGDFIEISQPNITTDDFVGNTYRMEYIVREKHLHGGCNYGRIFVETPYEVLCVPIKVLQHVPHHASHGEKEMLEAQGLKEYLAYISGNMESQEWMEKAIEKVKQLRELEPENEYFLLLQAHIYLRGKKEEEARWILDNYNYSRFAIGRKPEWNAYYLFLTASLKKDAGYTNRALEEINRLYIKYPYSWKLLCMLLHLDPKYRNYNERMRALERQFFNGANQILFYSEVYLCLKERVLLLRKVGDFEIQVLNFAVKYKLITKELALYAAELVTHQKSYDNRLYRILKQMYRLYEDPAILNALCMQLIKGNKTGKMYFEWYEKAVEQELKIAQLFEYYIMSVEEQKFRRPFPKIVYLYFMHGNHLDYKRKAVLYANILTYEAEDSDVYRHYQEEIEAFAWEQLLKRHINDSLRIIYNRYVKDSEMTPERLDALYDICHAYHVETKMPGMKCVLVIEKDGSIQQRAVYKDTGAIVYLYDKEARIVWEAKDGTHYSDSFSYSTKRLFHEIRFLELCKKRMADKTDSEKEKPDIPVTFENVKKYGVKVFDKRDVFLLCSKHIREEGEKEDDFLVYLCFDLLKEGYYDKALLSYLVKFYCGSVRDMKRLWRKAKEYEVGTHSLSERIITQMLFTESMFQEEAIFEDYYQEKPYFRVKQAYFAYVAREFVVKDRVTDAVIFELMLKEHKAGEELADICKAAVLKFFAEREFDAETAEVLRGFLRELCEKRMIFAYYLSYPEAWLKEVQLYDKVIVEYRAKNAGKVKIVYQINEDDIEGLDYQSEALLPIYETIYTKEFILYGNESVKYYFKETFGETQIKTQKTIQKQDRMIDANGKYGRLNQMLALKGEEQEAAMYRFWQEEEAARKLFLPY